MNTAQNKQHLKALRRWMAEEHFDAFIVPTIDPHNSEYTPDYWKAREWLTGFNGSAGIAVVTASAAALWTDSRYYLQAETQLAGTTVELMRDGEPDVPTVAQWLAAQLAPGCTIGYYGEMMTAQLRDDLLGALGPEYLRRGSEEDPFRIIWTDRPDLPATPVTIVPDTLTGVGAATKLRRIYEAEHAECPEAAYFGINDLSEIAWALNLRASDIPYNPLFVSYLFVGEHRAILFTDLTRLSDEVKHYLVGIGVGMARYKGWKNFIEDLPTTDVLAFPRTMNLCVTDCCAEQGIKARYVTWHVDMLRAVKSPEEQAGFHEAMVRDGVAMVRFLRWLDTAVSQGGQTELTVDKRLTALRAEQPGYLGLSFATIAGYAAHGAIVHYEADAATAAPLCPEGLLLLDSGAHYDCGTTDITRTIALGPVTDEERKVYTLVLKGHIGLSRCRFPEGTTGLQLDLAARYAMWQAGYDFGHGTGHGVGHRLCVHEGPQQIRKNVRPCTLVPFRAGMTITDEPGIYVTGRFGVRIENTLLTVDGGTTGFGHFLEFEPLTLCPIDLRPVDFSLLTKAETDWLNAYHATVAERLMPHLDDVADRQWLKTATAPVCPD